MRPERSDTFLFDAIDEVFPFPVFFFPDQAVNVGFETGKTVVEIAGEFQVIDDRPVEAFARNQKRDARRIRRQQNGGDTALESSIGTRSISRWAILA